jgi:TolB-like protein
VVVAVILAIGLALLVYYSLSKQAAPQLTTGNHIKSIAVLPFKPLVQENRDESLEMGMADTLITRLSNINQVIVRPTSSIRKYSDTNQDSLAAGKELMVDAVLDGSIQKSGERIRVTVRLVKVADGHQLWADHFDEKVTDIFVVQDSISRQVSEAIVKLTGGEKELLARRYTESSEAYSLYVKGRYFWNKRTAEGLSKAIDYFNQAIKKDPNYALAYAGLADAYAVLPVYSSALVAETHREVRAYAQKALKRQPTP